MRSLANDIEIIQSSAIQPDVDNAKWQSSDISSASILGVNFDFVRCTDVARLLLDWKNRDERGYITLTNPHSVMLIRRHPLMRRATADARLCLPDGVGVIVAALILGLGRQHRVTGPHLMLEICGRGCKDGLRHYFYGGGIGVADRLGNCLKERFPDIQIAGAYSPPLRELGDLESSNVIEQINKEKPDIIWVGLGAPKQEVWMLNHFSKLNATAIIGVGAAFDFHSGNVKWAPKWIRKCGMEWAYRLFREPGRLWRRNLDSPLFMFYVLRERIVRSFAALHTKCFGRD